jgi:hypothetical protein
LKIRYFRTIPAAELTGHPPENFRPKRRNHEFSKNKELRPFRATKETPKQAIGEFSPIKLFDRERFFAAVFFSTKRISLAR